MKDVIQLNKVVDKVKSKMIKVAFPCLDNIKDCHIECFSDASFGNLPDCGSQGGMVIFLTSPEGKRCPIYWQSKKIRRVVKSTLAAETLALSDCVEEAVHLSSLISELFKIPKLDVRCFVDNRSLVEAVNSSKPVEGKRLRIEISILKEMISRSEISSINWIPTGEMLANCLTKMGASSKSLLEAISL